MEIWDLTALAVCSVSFFIISGLKQSLVASDGRKHLPSRNVCK